MSEQPDIPMALTPTHNGYADWLEKTNGDGTQYFRSSSFIYYTVKVSL